METIVNLIIVLCLENTQSFTIQGELCSCQDYYVNCIVNNNMEVEKCIK